MGGERSQKLRPRRGIVLLSGAQQTSGSLQNQHCNGKLRLGSRRAPLSSASRRAVAQLQTAWVTFGKQSWVTSGERRRIGF